jgi:hypothetical protein
MIESWMKGSEVLLNEAIDRIAGWGATPEAPDAVASALRPDAIQEAAVIHISALLEADLEGVSGNELRFGGMTVRVEVTEDPAAPIRYDDVGIGFGISGVTLTRQDGPSRLEALLRIFQYARDRSDGLLYLPSAMRAERVAELAVSTGASERFVRFLLARYHTLSTKAAA